MSVCVCLRDVKLTEEEKSVPVHLICVCIFFKGHLLTCSALSSVVHVLT